jgi:hypothetical protein
MKYIIHETFKSGGGVTYTKGHDQKIKVALMSVRCSLGDVFLFHTYLVVARIEVKFGKLFSPTDFIQKVTYGRYVKFFLDGKFVEGTKIRTHAPSSFLNEDHDKMGRIGSGTWMDNASFKQFMDNFLNLFIFSKGMTIRVKIGRKTTRRVVPEIKGM